MAHAITYNYHSRINTTSGLDVVAGIWLVIAPFILNYTGMSMQNDIIVGVAVAVLAASRLMGEGYRIAWPSWVNAILGVWLIAAPFVMGYANTTATWNDVVLGIIVAILATTSALATPRVDDMVRP
jgi:hypothetical protein